MVAILDWLIFELYLCPKPQNVPRKLGADRRTFSNHILFMSPYCVLTTNLQFIDVVVRPYFHIGRVMARTHLSRMLHNPIQGIQYFGLAWFDTLQNKISLYVCKWYSLPHKPLDCSLKAAETVPTKACKQQISKVSRQICQHKFHCRLNLGRLHSIY